MKSIKDKVKIFLSKKWVRVLLILFIISMIAGASYKIGAMHSFFTVTMAFSSSEVICQNVSSGINSDMAWLNDTCYYHAQYIDNYCYSFEGIPKMVLCFEEEQSWKEKATLFIATGMKVRRAYKPIQPVRPMVLIE